MKKLLIIVMLAASVVVFAASNAKKFYAGVVCYKSVDGNQTAQYTEIKEFNVQSQDVLAKRAQLKASQAFNDINQDEEMKVYYFVNPSKTVVENLMNKKLEEVKAIVGENNVTQISNYTVPND
ncbi:MAG: hypothetical protein H6553_03030 [Chitinophagales bacterium]|nr:hypothetical protein [Chitinophagales bacterium]